MSLRAYNWLADVNVPRARPATESHLGSVTAGFDSSCWLMSIQTRYVGMGASGCRSLNFSIGPPVAGWLTTNRFDVAPPSL